MLNISFVETAKISEQPGMAVVTAGLWRCDHCQVWWGSQTGNLPEAHHLLTMAEPNTGLFLWEEYRGWHEKADEANVCPECGRQIPFPKLSLFSPIGSQAGR